MQRPVTKVKGHSFAHFCHDPKVRHFYPHSHECQFDVKRGNLSMQVALKITY